MLVRRSGQGVGNRRLRRIVFPLVGALLLVPVAAASQASHDDEPLANPFGFPVVDVFEDSALRIGEIDSTVEKAKLKIQIPGLVMRSDAAPCSTGVWNPGYPGDISRQCPKTRDAPWMWRYPVTDYPVQWYATSGNAYAASAADPQATYGRFPQIRVNTVAFGSVPVTATVTITQPVEGGYYDGLDIQYLLAMNPLYPGDPAPVPEAGPVPTYPPRYQGAGYAGVEVTGGVKVTISDVTIDEERLDVGDHCRTASPARIEMGAPAGYYPFYRQADGPNEDWIDEYRGKPGAFDPFGFPAGWLDGTIDIPSFAGCVGASGEDVSPIVTAVVSAPGNALSAWIDGGYFPWSFYANCEAPCPGSAFPWDLPATAQPLLAEGVRLQEAVATARTPQARMRAMRRLVVVSNRIAELGEMRIPAH
ncbi:hypothetical protein CCO04_18035 [Pimelobacter sp. 30-1]|nr:hypothetical protein [Pimelobacter sp. 30-1]